MDDKDIRPSIIDSYDGDPGDFITFKDPDEDLYVPDEEEEEAFLEEEYTEPEVIYENPASSREPENVDYEQVKFEHTKPEQTEPERNKADAGMEHPSEAVTENLRGNTQDTFDDFQEPYDGTKPQIPVVNGGKTGGSSGHVEGTINLSDEHYEGFQLDPYYDFGQGPEPKMPRNPSKGGGRMRKSVLFGMLSLIFGGLCFMSCCSFVTTIPLGIASISLGIVALSRKDEGWTRGKTMAIIGMLMAVLGIMSILASFGASIFDSFSNYNNSWSTSYPIIF